MSTVITRGADVFDAKIIVNEDKDKLKRKVKNLSQEHVGLKLIELNLVDEAHAK